MTPLPIGFRVVADRRTRRHDGDRLLVGGHPHRVLRLSDRGAATAHRLWSGTPVAGRTDGVLARRLIDAGLAHPVPPAATPSITVVIPAYDDSAALDRCLVSLGDELSVRVVDDGSADAAGIRAVANRRGATLKRLPRNAGPAAARNAGARDLTTDVIAFVDSDAMATPQALRQLATHFADPSIAAVAPRVRPSPARNDGLLGRFADGMTPLDLGPDPSIVGSDRLVTYVPSTVLLVRRTSFEAIGGFDPSLRFGEDVDLVWRLHAAGCSTRYAPEVRVGHEEPTGWRRWLVRRYHYGTSTAALARRHRSAALTLRLRPAPLTSLALAVTGRPRLAATAVLVTTARLTARLRRHDVPVTSGAAASVAAPAVTALGLTRWALPLWWPAVVSAGLRSKRGRSMALTMLVAPPIATWLARRPSVDPIRWTVASWLDAVAYGAGVWRGCWRERTMAPVLPVLVHDASASSQRHHTET